MLHTSHPLCVLYGASCQQGPDALREFSSHVLYFVRAAVAIALVGLAVSVHVRSTVQVYRNRRPARILSAPNQVGSAPLPDSPGRLVADRGGQAQNHGSRHPHALGLGRSISTGFVNLLSVGVQGFTARTEMAPETAVRFTTLKLEPVDDHFLALAAGYLFSRWQSRTQPMGWPGKRNTSC
ncbi:uncharacterized protein BP5553_09487 [Venustampulla echinocandica]|uniref:Uncharacterized protein n=1 Tax=Venustampulla echinocandica TaxID=2656787 RepID=A0A370TCX6_9HELO|nr:uncharacterized protein BP5553_09487 [Venustampulla echinocandica]RDL32085.1 hypothetical protein BP5553_09487 [Venustampulla echinocandica]